MGGRSVGVAVAVALLLGVLGAAGCDGGDTPAKSGAVRLGALFPLTGPVSESGQQAMAAARMAVQEANDSGGVLGRRVELVVMDDACDPHTAVTAANSLVGRDIAVSVGGACSVATVATVKIFYDGGVPMVIPAANSTDLVARRYNSVFLLSGTSADEGLFAVRELRRLGSRRVSVIDDGTTDSDTLAAITVQAANRPDSGLVVAGRQRLSEGAPSYRRTAAEVLRQGADAVYFTGYYAEAAQLIRDLKAVGYAGTIMLGDGAVFDSLLRRLTPAESEGVYGTALPLPRFVPSVAEWADRYATVNGKPPGQYTMESYDAVRLALDAIRRAGSTDRAAIRNAIATTGDLELLTGPVRFNRDGSRVDPRFMLLRVTDGSFTLAP